MTQPIVILSGIAEELSYVLDAMSGRQRAYWGKTEISRGRLGDNEVVAFPTGVGKVRASSATQYAIDYFAPAAVLLIGAAGALAADLAPGDVVVGNQVIEYDFDSQRLARKPRAQTRSWQADPAIAKGLVDAAERVGCTGHVRVGTILTGDQVVADAGHRDQLREMFLGDCVEMESAAVAAVCDQNEIPFAAVRIVSDHADSSARDHFIGRLTEIGYQFGLIVGAFLGVQPEPAMIGRPT